MIDQKALESLLTKMTALRDILSTEGLKKSLEVQSRIEAMIEKEVDAVKDGNVEEKSAVLIAIALASASLPKLIDRLE